MGRIIKQKNKLAREGFMDKLKFIKFIVFVLTFLLVFGIFCAGTVIYKKASANKNRPSAEINLAQPAGSHIDQMSLNGEKLYLLIKGKNMPDRIIVIDTSNQSVIATINNN